ncbi:bifunctional ADP-dependent NAD(P)H-hydrate dehydratase/NAD(P)H-hydrate epimerase [Tomitella fengzijianii]|uniref:ADP-dependent (S)-NAD(P)H-hydrate dehydratase n=1 Tax=Tomitella fengzijianii TaxID=2597660 RepID=A0A516X0N7_9ACTN|nr:bifunctional ADP-dependent NAD(P)H-hydrate dehydratase/NAD(P)H-hydrate epimerase [Tomitella fengzijianii]QDQ96656.1 bifunctional ADP-dependent NAD(P)H-hydrate dehydratase/NAD(P)H-hydrate epimerase [Tomitella fengzijianii]
MREFHGVDAVRAAEAPLLASLPEGTLMRRAAYGLARIAAAELARCRGGVVGRSVLVLAGSGDNGGDALFAGADLRRRGAAVTAVLMKPERAHTAGLADLRAAGGVAVAAEDVLAGRVRGFTAAYVAVPDLVIDGIVGISGRPGLRPDAAELVARLEAAARRPVFVAADLPSGVDPETGATDGPAVRADVTAAFGACKPVHVLGARWCGRVEPVPIGLTLGAPELRQCEDVDAGRHWPVPGADDDKYSGGVLGVVAGSQKYPGAAVLCAGSAVAATSAMVRYAGGAADRVLAAWPEVVATATIGEAGRVQAWAAGPGGGVDDAAERRLQGILATDVPVIVDADGLTILARHHEWVRERSAPTVLTPHAGEFARLTGSPVPADRLAAVRTLAADLGATVLLKGNVTLISEPGRVAYAEHSGHAWAATAGSGDVLTGIVGALLAAGLDPAFACAAAARVHSTAAGLAAQGAGAVSKEGPGAPVSASAVLGQVRAAVRAVRS